MRETADTKNFSCGESEPCPYRFFLRWTWPDHIEQVLRQAMWAWLEEVAATHRADGAKCDRLGAQLCLLMAESPATPAPVLDFIADFHSDTFKKRVAGNPNTLPSTLARLAVDGSPGIRLAVACNGNNVKKASALAAANLKDELKKACGH